MSEYCATDCDADAAAPHSLYANDKYARPSVGCMRACDRQSGDGTGVGHGRRRPPTCRYRFEGHVESPANVQGQIQQMIFDGGPVTAAFSVYEDFANYSSGIYHHVDGELAGGHAVKIVGWGEENGVMYWKIANSWNPFWGENGFFRMLRGQNECGIELEVYASDTDAKWIPPGPSA